MKHSTYAIAIGLFDKELDAQVQEYLMNHGFDRMAAVSLYLPAPQMSVVDVILEIQGMLKALPEVASRLRSGEVATTFNMLRVDEWPTLTQLLD